MPTISRLEMAHIKKSYFSSFSIIIYLVSVLGILIIWVEYFNSSVPLKSAISSLKVNEFKSAQDIEKTSISTRLDFVKSSSNQQKLLPVKILDAVTNRDKYPSYHVSTEMKHTLNYCNKAVIKNYQAQDNVITSQQSRDKLFCQGAVKNQGVSIGRSWGSLTRADKLKWDTVNCNELLQFGQTLSCDKKYGWASMIDWLNTTKVYATGSRSSSASASSSSVSSSLSNNIHNADHNSMYTSHVQCAKNYKSSMFCQYRNVSMDFSQVSINGNSRKFGSKFFTIYNTDIIHPINMDIPGLNYVNTNKNTNKNNHNSNNNNNDNTNNNNNNDRVVCDIYETRPVFLVSNDDIYNLGHYANDLITMWSMLVMANRNGHDSILLNFDGLRVGGPAGGGSHRLMDRHNPDNHGPFINYYHSWFHTLKKAKDYHQLKICFHELYLMPVPGVAYFWNDWSRVNECSLIGPSPLHQSFNLFFRQQWIQAYGVNSLIKTPNSYGPNIIHVVILIREINLSKSNTHSSARYIINLSNVLEALKLKIPNIKITVQNFGKISFLEQVALSHSAGVFVAMHGAGATHVHHMAIGSPYCCAFVELQPDHSQGFQTSHGYDNYSRMFGLHYYRYEAEMGATAAAGTSVNVEKVTDLVHQAVNQVRGDTGHSSNIGSSSINSSSDESSSSSSSSCLNNAKATTQGVFSIDYFNHQSSSSSS